MTPRLIHDVQNVKAAGSCNVSVLAPWDITLTLAGKDSVNARTGVVTVAGPFGAIATEASRSSER
jgi:hypothetical protein